MRFFYLCLIKNSGLCFYILLDFDYLCKNVPVCVCFAYAASRIIMDVNDFKIKWWQWMLYIVVSAGLLYITRSWLMSLGILLLLILLDRWAAEYERKKRGGDDDDILL